MAQNYYIIETNTSAGSAVHRSPNHPWATLFGQGRKCLGRPRNSSPGVQALVNRVNVYQSPCLMRFLIFRLVRSRFSGLR
jgi:hypothetical protein